MAVNGYSQQSGYQQKLSTSAVYNTLCSFKVTSSAYTLLKQGHPYDLSLTFVSSQRSPQRITHIFIWHMFYAGCPSWHNLHWECIHWLMQGHPYGRLTYTHHLWILALQRDNTKAIGCLATFANAGRPNSRESLQQTDAKHTGLQSKQTELCGIVDQSVRKEHWAFVWDRFWRFVWAFKWTVPLKMKGLLTPSLSCCSNDFLSFRPSFSKTLIWV